MTEPTYKRDQWLIHYDFEDPFSPESIRAEADTLLREGNVFIEFPYYENIKGQIDTPGPRFVFAGRGSGKTALRMRLQKTFDDDLQKGTGLVLAVTYNHFDGILRKVDHDPKKVRPQHHAEEIIRLIVKGLFKSMVLNDTFPNINEKVLQEERTRKLLSWYLSEFSVLQSWDLDRFLGEVAGVGYFLSKERLLEIAKGTLEITSLTLPPIGQKAVQLLSNFVGIEDPVTISKDDVSIVELLEELVNLCSILGFKAVYVLIDDVDEPQYYGEEHDYQPAFELIHSLASAPKLIGIQNLIFKFFLPLEIRKQCLQTLRLDKFAEQVIIWKYEDFKKLYERRLSVCDKYRIRKSLKELCDLDFGQDIDRLILDFAKEMGNPRALIYVGNELFTEHFRQERVLNEQINRATWERARQRAEEVLQ